MALIYKVEAELLIMTDDSRYFSVLMLVSFYLMISARVILTIMKGCQVSK